VYTFNATACFETEDVNPVTGKMASLDKSVFQKGDVPFIRTKHPSADNYGVYEAKTAPLGHIDLN
jgi:hypothetical protein